MATPNLFKAAKPAKKSSKPEKTQVVLQDKDIESKIARLAEINAKMDSLKAEATELHDSVKETSIKEFVKLYKNDGSYPGSFNIVAGKSSLMFIPTDRYINIDEERFEELKSIYGGDLVSQKNTYTMDSELVDNKYGEILSELIMKCKKIDEADKGKLISSSTAYTVKKGTINELKKFESKEHSLETIIEDIRPVFQLKSVKG